MAAGDDLYPYRIAGGLGAGGVGADEVALDSDVIRPINEDADAVGVEAIDDHPPDRAARAACVDLQPGGAVARTGAIDLDQRCAAEAGLGGAVDRYRLGEGR